MLLYFFLNYLLIFGCIWVFSAARTFSSCGKRKLLGAGCAWALLLYLKKKKTRIYLFFTAFGSSVPSPSSLLLQSNQKRWPHSFSVLFFFFLTSALFLIFTWTSFSNTSTTYLLLSSGFAPTTLLPVQSFILEENFGLFTSRF